MNKTIIIILSMLFLVLPFAYADAAALNAKVITTWSLDVDEAPNDDLLNNDANVFTGVVFNSSGCMNNGCFRFGSGTDVQLSGGGITGYTEFLSFSMWVIIDNVEQGVAQTIVAGQDDLYFGTAFFDSHVDRSSTYVDSGAAGWDLVFHEEGTFEPVNNEWFHFIYTRNATHYNTFVNGEPSLAFSQGATPRVPSGWNIGTWGNDAQDLFGQMDEVYVFNGTLSKEDAQDLYNSGDGLFAESGVFPEAPPPIEAGPGDFAIAAIDLYDGTTLENLTVSITNSSFSFTQSTSNGTILVLNSSFTFDRNYDIEFSSNQSGGYFNVTSQSVFINNSLSGNNSLFQSILLVNVTEVITNNSILAFTASVPLQSNISNSSGISKLLLKAGDFNINAAATGFITSHTNFSINPLETKSISMVMGTSNLTIIALSSDGTVNNFNTTLELISTGYRETKETNSGKVVFSTLIGIYNVTLNASGFAFAHEAITISAGNQFPNITFNLFSENSINITIFDEETNEIINYTLVTLVMDHENQKFTNTTNTGNSFFIGLFDGLWSLLASSPIHAAREYIFTIVPQSTSTLNVYLLNASNGEDKTFNIKNKQDQTLPDSTITVSNKINTSFVTVAQRVTDFAGQANIFLSSSNDYRFTVEANGFTTKIFDLTPVASAYDIIMDPTTSIDFTTVFNDVSFTIFPPSSTITVSDSQNFSIVTSSPEGMITYFGLNSSFNNTDRITNVTGSPAGGTASITINTTGFNSTTIAVDFFIKINGEDGIVSVHRDYRTSLFVVPGNSSAQSVADKYKDSFSNVGKSLIIVGAAVAVILALAEVGVPNFVNGVAGVVVIIFGAVVGWIPITQSIIVSFIILAMAFIRRAD